MTEFLWSDAMLVAVEGSRGMSFADGSWRPAGGSPAVAAAAREDERALSMSEAEASSFLEELGIPMPSFSAKDESSAAASPA